MAGLLAASAATRRRAAMAQGRAEAVQADGRFAADFGVAAKAKFAKPSRAAMGPSARSRLKTMAARVRRAAVRRPASRRQPICAVLSSNASTSSAIARSTDESNVSARPSSIPVRRPKATTATTSRSLEPFGQRQPPKPDGRGRSSTKKRFRCRPRRRRKTSRSAPPAEHESSTGRRTSVSRRGPSSRRRRATRRVPIRSSKPTTNPNAGLPTTRRCDARRRRGRRPGRLRRRTRQAQSPHAATRSI